jgi:hypothetical protein
MNAPGRVDEVAGDEGGRVSKRVLDPIDRVAEVLFGLIMVLTFTGSLSVANAGHAEVRTMLIGALGCNLAWGVIDALFYLMACLGERGHGVRALHAVREAAGPEEGRRVLADALPPFVASILAPDQLETVRERLVRLPDPPSRSSLRREDWRAALGVCLLVFASTLPAVLPFVFLRDVGMALRLSNGIAIAMLFFCGYSVGRLTGYHRWGTGLAMVLLGSALVTMTMALGG